ncbi:MAG: hypothetical protein GX621_01460, partial [Pirellulaceae bacterium]|nr:hypothetical protein [Pirellulaceae bacterium]
NKLTIGEVRVVAPVATSGNYIGGVTATATSTHSSSLTYSTNYLVGNTGMTDQHGPVGQSTAKSIANAGLWMNPDLGTNGFIDQAVTFDLGGTHSVSSMAIWNHNQSTWSTSSLSYTDLTTRGIKEALIEYSQDGGNTFVALADTNGAAAGNYTIAKASTGSGNAPIQNSRQLSINLAGLAADFIRITVKGNHGDTKYAGLSEVRFYGSSLIPTVPGDTNGDGIVDGTDSQVLAGYWGASVTTNNASKGDFNGDGTVNAADAAILAAHWGDHRYGNANSAAAGGEAAAAVPEPSVVTMLAALMLLAHGRRRRSTNA